LHVTDGSADEADLALTVVLAGLAIADHVRDELIANGIAEVRFSQLFVFAHLERGPATIGDIARAMRFSHQAASMLVNQLEAAGLARRGKNPDDGRSRLVELTPEGRRALRVGKASRDALLTRLRAERSDKELAAASAVMTSLLRLAGGIDAVRIRDLGFPQSD
jgi:DNA-binding MarR family transcriptional regulator